MKDTITLIQEADFYEQYKPVLNPIDPNAGWSGCMFETFGEEIEYVRSVDAKSVWTIVETDAGESVVIAGLHFVNRMGYLITEKPWVTGSEEVCCE